MHLEIRSFRGTLCMPLKQGLFLSTGTLYYPSPSVQRLSLMRVSLLIR